jgi:ABC-type glycerol-3-phosphate transport system permease component
LSVWKASALVWRRAARPVTAAALIVTLPVLVLTVFVQREIVGGLAAGAVKGG